MTGDSLPLDPPLLERLHARSGAVRWHVSTARFGAAIAAAVEKRFPQGTERGAVEAFVDGLHLEDLALAVGCAEGHELAWETFDARYRVDLRRAAAARTGETDGDEIVDALFVDLFARGDGSGRRSLFEYFHGRSKLGTWLRTLVAQRQVDRHRATRRFESLDAAPEGTEAVPAPAADPDPDRDRLVAELHAALDRGVAALAPRDRLRLACCAPRLTPTSPPSSG